MSQELKNVLIIGAGGRVGSHIVAALDGNPRFTLSVLSREGSKSTFPSHAKVFTTPESYPEDVLVAAFKGQDAVVDLAPLTAVDQQKHCIDAAVKAGVKRYIPSEFGSNLEVPEIAAAVPVFKAKTDVLHHLQSKEGQGLTWTAVITGPFLDFGLTSGFLGFDLQKKSATIYEGGNNHTDLTLLPTIGKAVVGILEHSKETTNRHVHINSYNTTQNQILAALEKATGSKWEIENVTCAEEEKKGKQMLAKQDFAGFGPAIRAVEYNGADYHNFEKFGLWNEKLGLPKTNQGLEETVKAIVAENHAS